MERMRALLLALLPIVLVLAACEKADRRPPDPDPTRAATNTATKTAGTGETPDADPAGGVEPGPEAEPEKPASAAGPEPEEEASRDGELIARRRYEQLVNGQRAGVIDVTWRWDTWNGERVVKDTTRFVTRTARMMGQVRDVFESKTTSELWRRPTGELLELKSVTRHAGGARVDRNHTKWTGSGYRVELRTGANREVIEVSSDRMAVVDAEAALSERIRAGEATPGATFTYPALLTGRKQVADVTLEVVGPDEEGPGLKVVESFENNRTLWWFADDGSVARNRSRNRVIRRAEVTAADLPTRPAAFRVTLPSNVNLPRLFTGERMVVDIEIDTDETTQPPHIPESAFTRELERSDDSVEVELLAHDDPEATATLPVPAEGLEEYLKAERTMEVDHPRIQAVVKRVLDGETDARRAATKLADWVFQTLTKRSPPLGEPTALQILDDPIGDCSEHNLLFVTLCRAAGIPARRCSGYVCIGDWGSHAWCEIYLGRWIGADATTNEIGTRARYILLARPDEPEVRPGRITAERTRLLIRRAEYVDGAVDVGAEDAEPAVRTGIRPVDPLPEGWSVSYTPYGCRLQRPGLRVTALIRPDQGYRDLERLAGRGSARLTTFGGLPCALRGVGGTMSLVVPLGREHLVVYAAGASGEETLEELSALLAPTLKRSHGTRPSPAPARTPGGTGERALPGAKPGR